MDNLISIALFLLGIGVGIAIYHLLVIPMIRSNFETVANRMLESTGQKLVLDSKEKIEAALQPFRAQIDTLAKDVKESSRSHIDLKGQIQQMGQTYQQVSLQAENLATALKGSSHKRGKWGEMILEKVLENSGLRKDEEYRLQVSFTDREEGGRYRPDAIVNLPSDKSVIVDAKTSLVDYEKYSSTEEEEERAIHLRAFLNSMRGHIKDLAEKNYTAIAEKNNLDFLLMFVPIESAFSLALEGDKSLMDYAWERRIVLVSPTTLLLALRTIYYAWQSERQNRNSQEIATEGGRLYDKVCSFVEDMEKHGQQLTTAQKSYEGAMTKLSSGRGNILDRTRKLETMGVKTSKQLPPSHEEE